MKYGISILSYNRPEYFHRMIDSMKKTVILPGTKIFISDDASYIGVFEDVFDEACELVFPECKTEILMNFSNIGAPAHYKLNLQRFQNTDVDYIISLDNDVVFNKNWMIELDKLITTVGRDCLASVFYNDMNESNFLFVRKPEDAPIMHQICTNKEIIIDYGTHYEKPYGGLNGMGLTFPKKYLHWLDDIHEHNHFDKIFNERSHAEGIPNVVTPVSYIQHIGVYGEHSKEPQYSDYSKSFVGE